MTLVDAFEQVFAGTRSAFSQYRVFVRARELAYGFVTAWERHTISQALCAVHAQFEDWSASYRFFSRSPWQPADVFQPVVQTAVAMLPAEGLIAIALDDTAVKNQVNASQVSLTAATQCPRHSIPT